MLSTVFLLATLAASAAADGYSCARNTLINPPQDLSKPYYYPETWRENMEPPQYAPNQKCNWKINVPQGMYATVIFYKKTKYEIGIQCAYPGKDLEYINDYEQSPYIFTSPQFQVDLKVGDKPGAFSFKVVWSKYPPGSAMNIELDGIHSISGVASSFYTTYTAINQVMIVGFSVPDVDTNLLRQSAIYDGDSVNAKFLGNLFDALEGQIVSTGNKLTIYTFGLENQVDNTLFMGLDTKAAGDIEQYTGLNCPVDRTRGCSIILHSYFYATAEARISRQPDYLMLPDSFPYNATLKIYGETLQDSSLFAAVNKSNYQTMFPMKVTNSLKIYHLDHDIVSIDVTNNADEAKWSTVYDGRNIKVQSMDYGRTSFYQDTMETFTTEPNTQMYFKFNVKYFDVNGPTSLAIKVYNNAKIVYSETYTATNLPTPYNVRVYGDKMDINYQTFGNYTQGFEVNIVTTKNG
ncbi:CUB-like domain-containing protein [Caenorhabditis elegans]|uniref:CUB-like domain-containing protein n=1 Tax=Caenorhabditis elegans TaxID=6239 RepID=H9G326_CAEEL|nr:CUB-like domain-containing protein [Caenorhabditis elegans]CCG28075.1 CUB-like domain-containing protein [Caenorhabditis elegans]|eukprot:NP_001255688.1 Infection Response Gene [Caenorhabditis elegans]